MSVYNGKENYIFISYSHRDSERVIPIVKNLQSAGFRVWYDEGIEAGTEWPEFVAEHLYNSAVVLVFLSPNALGSQNCTREIHFAISERKEMLVVHLEEVQLSLGMKMQLGTLQAIFYYKHPSEESFLEKLTKADILRCCKIPEPLEKQEPAPAPVIEKPKPAPVEKPTEISEPIPPIPPANPTPKKTEEKAVKKTPAKPKTEPKPDTETQAKTVEAPIAVEEPNTLRVYSKDNLFFEEYDDHAIVSLGNCEKSDIVIPELSPNGKPVTGIIDEGFRGYQALKTLTIPRTVQMIGRRAFDLCSGLESVVMQETSQANNAVDLKIGSFAFCDCSALTSVSVPVPVLLGDSAFQNCTKLSKMNCRLQYVYRNAFFDCKALDNLDITATTIFSEAFHGCTALKHITLTDTKIIHSSAFALCSSLKTVTLPTTLSRIDADAFNGCAITTVFIPASVTELGRNAFGSARTFYCEASSQPPKWAKTGNTSVWYTAKAKVHWGCTPKKMKILKFFGK